MLSSLFRKHWATTASRMMIVIVVLCLPIPSQTIYAYSHTISSNTTHRLARTQYAQIVVSSNVQWVNTGITISSGNSVKITANGSWSADPVDGFTTPNGYAQSIADNFLNLNDLGTCSSCASTRMPHWGALIGYIGNNPPAAGSYTSTNVRSEAQKVFVVGSNFHSSAKHAGSLWLNFNDDAYSDYASDNAGQVTATITTMPSILPGGLWVSPENGFAVLNTSLHFAALAYPTHPGDPLIDHVNFTALWHGTEWHALNNTSNTTITPMTPILCNRHTNCNKYSFDWSLLRSGVSNGASGPLIVSFDVYNKANNVNFAPNGTHQEEKSWIAPMRNWQIIGYQPGQGDHIGRDYWAVDLKSSNPSVYPTKSGKIVFAGWNCGKAPGQLYCYGYVVVIDHKGGYYSIYAHLAKELPHKVGDTVGINDQIGTMSDTGCSGCGIHLHFAGRNGSPNLGSGALFGANIPVRTPW